MPKRKNNKKGRRKGKGGRGRGAKSGNVYEKLNGDRIPKSLQRAAPFPMSMNRIITFQENILIQSANPYLVKDYRANSAYDPDAALGGGTLTGFALMANIYQSYHVQKISFKFTVVSNEPSVPVNFGFCLRDKQPSTTYVSWAECQYALSESPTTGCITIGETSGMGVYRSRWHTIKLGTVMGKDITYMADLDYASAVTTNPSQLIWLSFIALGATSATALTNGCILNLKIKFHTRFWSLVNIEPTVSRHSPDSNVVGDVLEAVYCDSDRKWSKLLREIPGEGGKMTNRYTVPHPSKSPS